MYFYCVKSKELIQLIKNNYKSRSDFARQVLDHYKINYTDIQKTPFYNTLGQQCRSEIKIGKGYVFFYRLWFETKINDKETSGRND